MWIGSVVTRTFGIHRGSTRSFPGGARCILLVNFVHSLVCSTLIVAGWMVLAWSRKSYVGSTEIVYICKGPAECIWVNIWCMLDWTWSQNCGNTLILHAAFKFNEPLNKLLNKLLKCCKKLYLLMQMLM